MDRYVKTWLHAMYNWEGRTSMLSSKRLTVN